MSYKSGTAFTLRRRVGSTNYTVNAFCSDVSAETFEDKIIRLVRNKAMEIGGESGIMVSSQTSRQSERSAS